VTRRRVRRAVRRACGWVLLGVGVFACVHPEYPRGQALTLVGVAALARGSTRVERGLARIGAALGGTAARPRARDHARC